MLLFIHFLFTTGIKISIPDKIHVIQQNEYETAPYFLQFSQNMTSICLFTIVFFHEFTCFALKIVVNTKIKQFSEQNR